MDDQEKLRVLAKAAREGDQRAVEYLIGWVQDLIEFQPPLPEPVKGRKPDIVQQFYIHDLGLKVCAQHLDKYGEIRGRSLVSDIILLSEIEGEPLAAKTVRRGLERDGDLIIAQAKHKKDKM